MKENSNNLDDNNNNLGNRKSIKEMVKYFDIPNRKEFLKNKDNINDIKNKNILFTIYKNYIMNKQDNPNMNENIINTDSNNNINNNINDKKLNDNNYYFIINQKLLDIHKNTISFLDNIKNEMNKNYLFFSDRILKWIKKRDKKLSNILSDKDMNEKILEYINKNIFDKIKKIFEIHDNIFNSIKDHFTILNLFLSDDELIKVNSTMEEFILKNSNFILNSFFLSKINMETLSLSKFLESKDLSDLFKNYYSKKKEEVMFKSLHLVNDNKNNDNCEQNISRNSFVKISKLKLKGLSCDNFDKIYKKINKGKDNNNNQKNSNKIKIISLSNIELFPSSMEDLSKIDYPILEKLKIKNCLIPFKNQSIFQSFISKTTNLKTIKIEKVKLSNKSLYDFVSYISNIKPMLDSIQHLSFKSNILNSINFDNLRKNGLIFNNLEIFDLSDNNIYHFSTNNFISFPKLAVLDISNNNFNNNLFFESVRESKSKNLINFLVFMCKNIFLYNVKENNKNYLNYINDNLPNFNYKIKSINLGLLYNKENSDELKKLIFSPVIKLSLILLDLSYCGLTDNIFASFLKNNFDLMNLTKLNLSNNLFTIKFFSVCLQFNSNNDYDNISLEKIKIIDLSFNNIKYQTSIDLQKINKFIDKHYFLKKIKLQNNEILNIFKKTENNIKYKDNITQMINLCNKRNIKFIIQTELINEIDNDNYQNIFIYKNKYS